MSTKKCNHCKEIKSIKEFGILGVSSDGYARRCFVCSKEAHKIWYYKNHSHNKEVSRLARNKRYWNNPDKHRKVARDSRRALRLLVLEQYGDACACCGETEETFLTIDHINGDGNRHREEVGNTSTAVYRVIRQEGYPTDKYQILCFNCNRSKYVLGICAHKSKNI